MGVTDDVIEDDKGQQIMLVGVQSDGTPTKLLCDSNGKLKISTTGGGGSGTVTSVAVSGSDGIEIDSGSPVTTSGTIALGVNKTTLLSHINVEDGADVTDATNVESAGAIMDGDFTTNGLMKRTGAGAYTTATADTDYQDVLAEGAFADGDKTKLNGIESGADVTDATNVAAAGALMKTATVNTNTSPGASAADSGEYFYITTGSFTLPNITSVGEQYVVLNNKGSSLSIGKDASDSIVGATSIDDDKAATIVAVTTSTWFVVG